MRWLLILITSVICISIKSQIYITPFMPDEIVDTYPDAAKVLESKLNAVLYPKKSVKRKMYTRPIYQIVERM